MQPASTLSNPQQRQLLPGTCLQRPHLFSTALLATHQARNCWHELGCGACRLPTQTRRPPGSTHIPHTHTRQRAMVHLLYCSPGRTQSYSYSGARKTATVALNDAHASTRASRVRNQMGASRCGGAAVLDTAMRSGTATRAPQIQNSACAGAEKHRFGSRSARHR